MQDPELLEELQLAAEPPGPPRRSKYAGDPEGVQSCGLAWAVTTPATGSSAEVMLVQHCCRTAPDDDFWLCSRMNVAVVTT